MAIRARLRSVPRLSSEASVLKQALVQLDPECRRVLILKFFHRLSTPEVATLLQCSEAAVRQLQYRGLSSLHRGIA
jgi:RNA polymerase sigma factor (sigma-70 family)